jgi:hypothetical protein
MNVYCILDILFIFYYSIYTTQKSQEVESAWCDYYSQFIG